MRIEYEPTILNRIMTARVEAKFNQRVIKRIVLTVNEWEEFCRETEARRLLLYPHNLPESPFCQYDGIKIDVELNGFRP